MLIRKCTQNDLLALSDFYDKTVFYLINHINYPKWRYKDYPSYESVKESIKQNVQFVCIENDKVLGAFVLNDNPQGAYENGEWSAELNMGDYLVIHTLATDPECYGRGIGKFMVRYCIDHAKNSGYKAIRLDVVPENLPARKLYESMGFTFAGEKDLERNIKEIPEFVLYEMNF